MARRPRTDTAAGAVAIAQARREICPPANVLLAPEDLAFWGPIIALKPSSQWDDHSLQCAAFLARSMGQLEHEQNKLREEGSVLVSDKGSLMQNPRVAVVHGLQAQVKAQRQSLGLHDRGLNGEARDAAKRRKAASAIEADLEGDLNGLLN